jgi:hypothetical protein
LFGILSGAIGVFTCEFWFSARMQSSLNGPFERAIGSLFLVGGLYGIWAAIRDLVSSGDESSHREERPVRPKRMARKAVVGKPQPDEAAAAEDLGLDTKEKARSRGDGTTEAGRTA